MTFPLPQPPKFDHRPEGRVFDHTSFTADQLLAAKGDTTITVALPAKDEAATIGPIIETIVAELIDGLPLIDELLVMDDLSSDETATLAKQAGATVISTASVLAEYGAGGKGEALWKSLRASTGDLIVWCDADIRNFDTRFILGCLGPLLVHDVGFIKGFYRRPLNDDGEGGGRVTELVARPLIATLFPDLAAMFQPLSGEFGGRREILERVPFSRGYAVDLALLIDISRQFGIDRIAQVDLGSRVHRNRPLRQLGPQSAAIMAMALRRAGIEPQGVEENGAEKNGDENTGADRLIMQRPEFGDANITVGDLPALVDLS
ncbi:MAG: glucosyl-3-phosphoglycerate synthase [Acidimicrobiales bacterium]